MTLTFQITDEALSILKDELRVSGLDYDMAACDIPATVTERYAYRILRARKMLELSVAKRDACYDLPDLSIERERLKRIAGKALTESYAT